MHKRLLVTVILVLSLLACLAAASFLVYRILDRASDSVAEEQTDDVTVNENENQEVDNSADGLALDESDYGGEYTVTNPTSGSDWYVRVIQNGDATTALVLVPGGRNTSSAFLSKQTNANDLVDKGYTVVIFDPEGRGKSEGEEDDNGTMDQDGLKAVVDFAAQLNGIEQVGIVSFSYGVTMASGMLARYPDSAVFLIDWEGPADRTDTGGCDADKTGHLQDAGCTNEAFWAEREALTFIGDIGVPYMRLQSEKDHAQPDYGHTIKMVNEARTNGVLTYLNGSFVGALLIDASMSSLVTPESLDRTLMERIAGYVDTLLAS